MNIIKTILIILIIKTSLFSSTKELYVKENIENIFNKNLYITKKANYTVPKETFYSKIISYYEKMRNTKYKLGGTTMSEIDCSAFIRKFYKEEFNVNLTRSTHTQVYEGIPVDRLELKLGDLIFFKEKNKDSNHVGIYLGKGKMIHSSSTNKGVAIDNVSRYENIYWTSRRVLDIES